MVLLVEETRLRRAALVYVMNLHNGLTQENGAPPLGTQNQTVDFILRDPELRRAPASVEIDEATLTLRRLPQDALYHRVFNHLEQIMGPRVFATAREPGR